MSCDIHAFIEYEVRGTMYDFCGNISINRWYALFAAMANVRNDGDLRIEPVVGPRGLPEDVSHEVRRQSNDWNGDAHSHSWLTTDEFEEASRRAVLSSFGAVDSGPEIRATIAAMRQLGSRARLVFWFDN